MKKLLLLFILLTSYSTCLADKFWTGKISDDLKPGAKAGVDLIDIIENIVIYLVGFLYLVAITLGLYAWFIILTSWWEEEKVKKWKNMLVYVIIWLIVIFFSSVLINWIIDTIQSEDIIG